VRVNQTWWMCGASQLVDGGTMIFTHAIAGWSYQLGIIHGRRFNASQTVVLSYQVGCGQDCSAYCNSSMASIVGCGITQIRALNGSHTMLTGPGEYVIQTGSRATNVIKGSCNANTSVATTLLSPSVLNAALAFALSAGDASSVAEGVILSLRGMIPRGNPAMESCALLPLGGTSLYRPVSVPCPSNVTTGKTAICSSVQGCPPGTGSAYMVNGGCYGCGNNRTLTSVYQPLIYGLENSFPYGVYVPASSAGYVSFMQTVFRWCVAVEGTKEAVIIILDATCESGFKCVLYTAGTVTGTVMGKGGRCYPVPNRVVLGPGASVMTSMAAGEVGSLVVAEGTATLLALSDIDQCPFYAGLVDPCGLDIGQSVTVVAGATIPYPLADFLDCNKVHISASQTGATTRAFLQFHPSVSARFPFRDGGVALNASDIQTQSQAFLYGLFESVPNMSSYFSATGVVAGFLAGLKAEYSTLGRGTNNYTGMDFLLKTSSMINLYFALSGHNVSAPSGASTAPRPARKTPLGFTGAYPKDFFYNYTLVTTPSPGLDRCAPCAVNYCYCDATYKIQCDDGSPHSECHVDHYYDMNWWRYYYLRYLWISGSTEPPLSWFTVTNSANGRRNNFPPNVEPPFDWMHAGVAHIPDFAMDDALMMCNQLDPRWFSPNVLGGSWPGVFADFTNASVQSIVSSCFRYTNPNLMQWIYLEGQVPFTFVITMDDFTGFDRSCNYYSDKRKSPSTASVPRQPGTVATQQYIVPPGLPPSASGSIYFSPGMAPAASCTDTDVMAYAFPYSLKYPRAMTTVLHSLYYLAYPNGTLITDSVVPPVADAQAYVELAVLATMECNGYGDLLTAHSAAEARSDTDKIDICVNPPVSMHASDGDSPACAILYSQLVSNICGGGTFTLMGARWNATMEVTSRMLDAGCGQADLDARSDTTFLGDPERGLFIGVPDMGCSSGIQCVPIPSPFSTDPLQYVRWGLMAFFYRMIAVQGVFEGDDAIDVAAFAEFLFPPPVPLVVAPISSRPAQCYVPTVNSSLFSKSVTRSGIIEARVGDFGAADTEFISSGSVTIECVA